MLKLMGKKIFTNYAKKNCDVRIIIRYSMSFPAYMLSVRRHTAAQPWKSNYFVMFILFYSILPSRLFIESQPQNADLFFSMF